MFNQASPTNHRYPLTDIPTNWLHIFRGRRNGVIPLAWTRPGGQKVILALLLILGSLIWNEGLVEADFNGDGFADAVFGSGFGSSNNKVCLGDGVGNFTCDNIKDSFKGFNPAVGDMNNDGLPDVVFSSVIPDLDQVCLNAGEGVNGEWGGLECHATSLNHVTIDVALGYVDDDQNLDAVFAGPLSEIEPHGVDLTNIVALGDGAGGYKELIFLREVTVDSRGVALGDFDKDGLLDAVFATSNVDPTLPGQNLVCLQRALHTFQCNHISQESTDSRDVAVADLNGDGNLDAVFANLGEHNTLCLGDGSGTFSCTEFDEFLVDDVSIGVALGEMNGDGTIDALFANFDADGIVCGNALPAVFFCAPSQTGIQKTLTVAMEDLNGDSVSDAVFGNQDSASRVCLGRGLPTLPFLIDCREINTGLDYNFVALSPGTFTADDSDGDSVSDDNDNCPQDANSDQADTDGDGAGDACDECPDDPNKIISGICGCGQAETDSDNDATLDCQDICHLDPEKIDPGLCGCGVADTDSDGDGVADCQDLCPGFDDHQDHDGDGLPDGCDLCPNDPGNDADGDRICGDLDMCQNTTIPEGVPTQELGQNRFALVDGDTTFDTRSPKGKAAQRTYTLQNTAGCSCEQIIAQAGLGKGHSKFGCSLGAMEEWMQSVNP